MQIRFIAGIKTEGQIDSNWESYFLISAAEIGILLASVSTYRAFFVSLRKGNNDRARRGMNHQRHWYDPRGQVKRGVLPLSRLWLSKTRGHSKPGENRGEEDDSFNIGKLPEIPGAHMTGVLTFINGRGNETAAPYVMDSVTLSLSSRATVSQ